MLTQRYIQLWNREADLDEEGLEMHDNAVEKGFPATWPTIVWAPANVVEQHFNEIIKYYPAGTFDVKVYHGSRSSTSHNPALQAAVMTTEQLLVQTETAVTESVTSLVSEIPRVGTIWCKK